MTAEEYIILQLEALKMLPPAGPKPKAGKELADAIWSALMSKKFRKFSVPEKNKAIIRAALEKDIANNEPIKIVWPFGAYKLWRLEEAPEVDWAELFSLMYFIKWLKPVCAMYKRGVDFTFWSDAVVIAQLNNISSEDLASYSKSFEALLDFIKPFSPSNLNFSLFQEGSRYESLQAFQSELAVEVENLRQARVKDPKPLSEAAIRSIEMNVKLAPGQADDPLWREKVDLVHYAYYNLQEHKVHSRMAYITENITAFSVFFEPNVIPIGTTKTSIVRFWVGAGVLEKRGDTFIETVLSPTQIDKVKAHWEPASIDGLEGKNFSRIRVI
jgi:hypothetical protein